MSPSAALEASPLYLAATRPALVPLLGVPYHAALVLLTVVALVIIFLHNPLYVGFVLPVWGALVMLHYHDHNALRVLDLWSRTSLISVGAIRCGGAAPEAHPLPRGRRASGRGCLRAAAA